jgi:hypothetical protein
VQLYPNGLGQVKPKSHDSEADPTFSLSGKAQRPGVWHLQGYGDLDPDRSARHCGVISLKLRKACVDRDDQHATARRLGTFKSVSS